MTYRAKEPLLGVHDHSPTEYGFVTIPTGAMLATAGEVQRSGFVNVLYEGGVVAVFLRDLETRAELVEVASPGKHRNYVHGQA